MEKEFKDIQIELAVIDGISIKQVITAKEQKEAAKDGITVDDLIDLYIDTFELPHSF